MKKSMFTPVEGSLAVTDELELINRHTLKPLTADEVFCFTLTLCDNEIDRDLERFSVEALSTLAELFDGKTGIADHSMKSGDQLARIFKTWVEEDEGVKTAAGENYTCLKARAYIPVTVKNAEMIAQIKAGIKKETSVGCAVGSVTCSVCGADLRKGSCKHRKGTVYDGKVCHSVLSNPTDAYEWSFVAVPAQVKAGVTKAFEADDSLSLEDIEKQARGFESVTLSHAAFEHLTRLTKDAALFREQLEKRVTRLAALAVPKLAEADFGSMCKLLTAEQLSSLEKAFIDTAAKNYPITPQLAKKSKSGIDGNKDFKI